MTSKAAAYRSLVRVVESLGYPARLRQRHVAPPGASAALEFVAYTTSAPQDLRTSAIAGGWADRLGGSRQVLDLARRVAAPVAIVLEADEVAIYSVGVDEQGTDEIWSHDLATLDLEELGHFRRSLDPEAMRAAQTGSTQLSLFPIDVRLLERARSHSSGSLTTRLLAAFGHITDSAALDSAEATRLVVMSLAAAITRDKYNAGARTPKSVLEAAALKHPGYFSKLITWADKSPTVAQRVIDELLEGVDYRSIDARTVNAIYEQLFVDPQLRKELGIFHTDHRLATRILSTLPIEELPPDERTVLDPACGSGNLLLAAVERLEGLTPGTWDAAKRHSWLRTHVHGADVDPFAVDIARMSLLVSALPLGNTWDIAEADVLESPISMQNAPNLLITNPPWHSPKGRRAEKASEFLAQAIRILADGGFLACLMPASWLSTATSRHSRSDLSRACEVFEVWRLPRDMFPGARVGCGVVFARKTRTPSRKHAAFRWVNATERRREAFVASGETSYEAVIPAPAAGAPLVAGPLDRILKPSRTTSLGDLATDFISGVVQKGSPVSAPTIAEAVPMLTRKSDPTIYRRLDPADVTWVNPVGDYVASGASRIDRLLVAPKLLVQADRFPDNPWRVRCVVDQIGVVPVGLWHAVTTKRVRSVWALHALMASSVVSCWIHTHVVGKRITIDDLRQLPLPNDWNSWEKTLASLGRRLADRGPTDAVLKEVETIANRAYGLNGETINAVTSMMSGFEAPEARVRMPGSIDNVPASPDTDDRLRSGAVLDVEGDSLLVWTLGGNDDGHWTKLPNGMPGWLCEKGSTFLLRGHLASGSYYFHSTAYLDDDDLFGPVALI